MKSQQIQHLDLTPEKGISKNPYVKKKGQDLPNNIFWMQSEKKYK